MRKLLLILTIAILLCSCVKPPVLTEDAFSPSPDPSLPMATKIETPIPQDEDATPAPVGADISLSLEERMAVLSFIPVSGQYVRRSLLGDVEYTEMFALDKSTFVRAALNETEEEVFAYNYRLDQFTYMYFFEGEMLSKMVYDIGAETVLEDADGLQELLIGSARDLKDYFFGLLDRAAIGVEELR